MSWSRRFETPVHLDDGRTLVTLRDAGEYIAALPPKTAKLDHWQTAMGELLIAAERGGIRMLAEIAVRQALNHGKVRPVRERKRAKRYRIVR